MVMLLLVAAVVIVGVVLFVFWKKRQTGRLRHRFGEEYDRTVNTVGSQRKAEQELLERTKRVEKFEIRSLTAEQIGRFTEAWRTTQAKFVDQPSKAVSEADGLVKEVMTARGYPMGDFEQRAADISVHHPRVVGNYRIARDIASKNRSGKATTEDLRQALVAYRELFVDLLEPDVPATTTKKKSTKVVEEVHHGEHKGAYRH